MRNNTRPWPAFLRAGMTMLFLVGSMGFPGCAISSGKSKFDGLPVFKTIMPGGWNIWRMAFWAEIDYILEEEGPDDVNRWAGHGEVNWLVADWLNF